MKHKLTPGHMSPRRRSILRLLSAPVANAGLCGAAGLTTAATAGTGLIGLALSSGARAAAYPDKPIKLIVPFATGGATDILARLIGRAMEPALGQNIIIDNRVGAAGAIGGTAVAKAEPDGYTVLFGGLGTNIVLNMTTPSTPYDAEKDLAPVCYLCDIDYVMVVAASSPYRSLSDLLGAAKAKPSTLSYMSTGQNGPLHVAIEYLSKQANVKMIHVPYKGESPALTDLMSGRIDVAVMTVPFTKPLIQDNRLRPIATISGNRAKGMPEVKTVAEQGFPGYAIPIWNGLFVPIKTPEKIVDTLNKAAMAALQDPAITARMLELGVGPTGSTPSEYSAMLVKERERWSRMIRETGVLNG